MPDYSQVNLTQEEIERLRRRAFSTMPLIARLFRRGAIRRLRRALRQRQALEILVDLCDHPDEGAAAECRNCLEKLSDEVATDGLCELAIEKPGGRAAEICLRGQLRPSDHDRLCVFLFVTNQLDSYFEEDFEFQCLRREYEDARPELRQHILRILRSGDRRCLAFFSHRKLLNECSEQEILRTLRSFHRHRDWSRLFHAFQDLPLRYGLRILHDLARTNWEPESKEERALYRRVLEQARGQLPPPSRPAASLGAAFEIWIEMGKNPVLAAKDVEELLGELVRAAPPRAVALVSALSDKASPGSEASREILEHHHWLVRLAGHVTGLCIDFRHDGVDDRVQWVPRVAPEFPILEFQPGDATPALLEELSASVENDSSKTGLSVARKVLQSVLAHRITVASFEEMIVEIEPFAGEFEEVDSP